MTLKFGIMGAGAIGGYLGVRLSAAGYPVTMIGRPALLERASRLSAMNLDGHTAHPAEGFVVSTDPQDLADVDICLLTVKGRSTVAAAQTLRRFVIKRSCGLVSKRIQNVARIESQLEQLTFGGMVTFNVVGQDGPLTKGTSGPLMFGQSEQLDPLAEAFEKAGEPYERSPDMLAVQRGKLLLNLNNGVCAATGLSILHSIQNPVSRRVFRNVSAKGRGQ